MVTVAIRALELEYLVKIFDWGRNRYIFTNSDSTTPIRTPQPYLKPGTSIWICSHFISVRMNSEVHVTGVGGGGGGLTVYAHNSRRLEDVANEDSRELTEIWVTTKQINMKCILQNINQKGARRRRMEWVCLVGTEFVFHTLQEGCPVTWQAGAEGRCKYIITPPISDPRAKKGWVGWWRTLGPGRFTTGKAARYSLYRRVGGHQRRYMEVSRKSHPPGVRTAGRPGHGSHYTNCATPATHWSKNFLFETLLIRWILWHSASSSCGWRRWPSYMHIYIYIE
jgi:hypothetical protein